MSLHTPPSNYWDFDDQIPLHCLACGYTVKPSIDDDVDAFLAVCCGHCETSLMHILWPTVEETRAAATSGKQAAARDLPRMEATETRQTTAQAVELKTPEQLPSIDDDNNIVITWDFESVDDEHWTVLRHGNDEIFREYAYWEGIDRFPAVVDVLKAAYGTRLSGVQPTSQSLLYLYGDNYSAAQVVKAINEQLSH